MTADELLELAAKPALIDLLRKDPTALVDTVVSLADDGKTWDMRVHNVDVALPFFAAHASPYLVAQARACVSATSAPVIIRTRDELVHVRVFVWAHLLGEMAGA